MKSYTARNRTSVIDYVVIRDTTGSRVTGLAYTDMSGGYVLESDTWTELTFEDIDTLGTWAAPTSSSHLRFAEVDETNAPGLYEVQYPDAWFAGTHRSVVCQLRATGADHVELQIVLDDRAFNVTLGQVEAPIDPGNQNDSELRLEAVQGQAKTWTIQCAGDVSGLTLRFITYTRTNPAVGQWKLEDPDVQVSGDDSTIVLAAASPTETATAGEFSWALWDVGNDDVVRRGTLGVEPAVKDIA